MIRALKFVILIIDIFFSIILNGPAMVYTFLKNLKQLISDICFELKFLIH